jgi:hypothetical protein
MGMCGHREAARLYGRSGRRRVAVPMSEVTVEEVQKAVEEMHECSAAWVEAVPVIETFQGKTVWNGVVQAFAITGKS